MSLADGATGPAVGRFVQDQCASEVVYITANIRRLPDDLAGDLLAALGYVAVLVRGGRIPDKAPPSLKLPQPQSKSA